jgi:hypothetical protein
MENGGADALVHETDDNYVKFSKLLARAVAEGRVDGKWRMRDLRHAIPNRS